jgi:glutathione synthase/RimK-type ligase-like ATP-grasp enzyme
MKNNYYIIEGFLDWWNNKKKPISNLKTNTDINIKKYSDFKKQDKPVGQKPIGQRTNGPVRPKKIESSVKIQQPNEPQLPQPTPLKKGDCVVVANFDNLNPKQNDYLRSKMYFEVEDVTDSKGNPYTVGTPFVKIGYKVPLYMSRFIKIEKPKPDPNKPKILFLNFDIPINLYGEEDKKNFFKGYKTMCPVFLDIFRKIDPGIYVDFKNYNSINRMDNDIYVDNIKIRDYDFVFFGLISQFTTTCKMVINYLDKWNIPYLKYGTYKEFDSKDYEFYLIESLGLPYIPSILTSKLSSEVMENIKNIGYPLIFKDVYLNQGMGIKVINNETELKNAFSYNTGPKLLQKLIPNDGEYRVLLIKNKVTLVMKKDKINRITKEEMDKRKSKIGTLPKNVLDMCEFVSKNLFCDIVGVDIIQNADTKKYYIMETNSAPHLPMFSIVSEINVMQSISNYIIEKINKKSKQTKMEFKYEHLNSKFKLS